MESSRGGRPGGYRAARREHWRSVLDAWKSSGLSVREYCRRKSLRAWTLYAWKRRLGIWERTRVPALVPVRVAGVAPVPLRAVVEVALRGGRLVRIHAEWSPETVARLVSALEPASC